jgi:hypothetical protein
MAKADPNAKWYQDQLARARERRQARAAERPPRPPGLRSDPERYRAYNREWMRAHYQPRTPRPKQPKSPRATSIVSPPITSVPDGHELFEQAKAALRSHERHELGSDFDSNALDLIGEFVVAALEGRDPYEAMADFRRGWQKRRAITVSFHEPSR